MLLPAACFTVQAKLAHVDGGIPNKNMFALLEKPGFEEETRKIKSRI